MISEMNVLGVDKVSHRIGRYGFKGDVEKGKELAEKMMDESHCIRISDGRKTLVWWDIRIKEWVVPPTET